MQALPTVSLKSKKFVATEVNHCQRTCNGKYDACNSAATDLNEQRLCFSSRLHCIKDCDDTQNKRNYLT